MPHVTQMELNTLKELIATEDLNSKKFKLYANNCNDAQLTQFFNEQALTAANNAQSLISFLNNA